MGKKLDKFLLLMWKNWKLQYRRPLQTTIEIAAPILFSVLLVILRSLVDPEDNPPHIYKPFHPIPSQFFTNPIIKSKDNATGSSLKEFMIVYSPSPHTILDRTMNFIKPNFKHIKGYKNSKELESHFLDQETAFTLAGIQFDDELNETELPHDLRITLRFPGELRAVGEQFFGNDKQQGTVTLHEPRNDSESVVDRLNRLFHIKDWKTNLLYPVFQSPGPREPKKNSGALPSYYLEGFLALQVLLTYLLLLAQTGKGSVISVLMGKSIFPVIHMQRFPYPGWKEDPLLPALISFIGMLIMLSFVYTCINTVKVITTEKEKQLKETMKIMGLPNWLHWTAWFIKSLSFLLISIICITVLLTITWYPNTTYSIFTHTNPLILFLFLLFYICATITFCFSVSVFFSKANTAAAIAGLLWFLSYAPYLFLQKQYDQMSLSTKLVVSLGSNTAMAYGFQLFLMYEGSSEGIQWHNIWKPNTPDDSLTLGLVLVMLTIDALLYLAIALYVEAVFPGEYGTPQPWYFPLSYSYWCGYSKVVDDFGNNTSQSEFFEKDPQDLNPGIQIRNLRKVFGKKVAVNNLSLNIYLNQITVLLGHNGAGKTTTMSILTGIIPPTSGSAVILGFNILTNMKNIRANLGLCPQHNILFNELTVKEHLYFFSKLKDLDDVEIEKEVNKYIQLLDLEDKTNKKSETLSGGMKRKLCVGIAFCGGSKVVLLDEPTAGMDPSSRRALWDLIQIQKTNRCILLTTHYMDEADLLGDKIVIMANGELKCYGTSFFLKKKYGVGYHLILDKLPTCDPEEVTRLLRKYIPDIKIHGNVGSELSYLLEKDHIASFKKMLQDLEGNTENLGIRSYGISLTTLEDVFMKAGADTSIETEQRKNVPLQTKISYQKTHRSDSKTVSVSSKVTLLTDFELIRNQFIAMLMKRSLSILRAWLLLIIQNIIPVAFLIIAIVVSRNINKKTSEDLPSLPLSLDQYEGPVILMENNESDMFSNTYYDALSDYEVVNVTNITETMLNLTQSIPATVREKYLVGAGFSFDDKSTPVITAWFNNNPYHTPGLALGLVLDTVYKSVMGKNSSITFVNHPLPFTTNTKIDRLLRGQSMGFQVAFNVGFSMSFVSSFYVLFYVKERVCKSKHLQFVSGVKGYIFWTTALLCDLVTFTGTILCIIVTLICFQEDGFRTADELGRIFFLLFYFGLAMLPMMYFASYFFEIPSTGYTRMALFSVFTGVTAFLVVQILSTPGLYLKHVADGLHWAFLVIPHYSLATGIRDTYITFATTKMCNFYVSLCMERNSNLSLDHCWYLACYSNVTESLSNFCCERTQDYFKWTSPGIGRNILYSLVTASLLFILLNLVEYKPLSKMTHFFFRGYTSRTFETIPDEDQDVLQEKEKIHNTPQSQLVKEHILLIKDLTKYYKNFLAVNGLCLGVKQYECFGLLGTNGAGKTTTFKMITGDVKITYGDAWIRGFSVKSCLKDVQKLIGYCPQFDALLTDLTAQENLIIFALIRGVPLSECKYLSELLAQEFDFYQHLNKRVKQLSGGNKRKLSTAISLIGDPPVICLDEPTAGMDPVTKRHLWNALCNARDKGKCILFTSHSMEECEALCTRLAIMVNGNFKCLGSVQHLKSKFAAGYTLTIKINSVNVKQLEAIDRFVLQNFPNAVQQEKHQELVTYYIVDKNVSWSKMFGILESNKDKLNIEDYFLGQASLEQIFLKLTKHQR